MWGLYVLTLLALPLLLPELSWAAEAGEVHHKAFSLKEELFKLMNTLIVIAILYKVAYKPIRKFFQERREGIQKALAEAQKARVESERLLGEQRSKVADLEAELGRVRKQGEMERESMWKRLQSDQDDLAERLLEHARGAIELEGKKARAELQNEAARLAVELAEEILRKNLGPEDQKRLMENFLSKVATVNGGGI
ncbi:MAG: ATP synthase F0 subunit B [bacterium]|nr:ATP synthase F0 subunit B [bacterium]